MSLILTPAEVHIRTCKLLFIADSISCYFFKFLKNLDKIDLEVNVMEYLISAGIT